MASYQEGPQDALQLIPVKRSSTAEWLLFLGTPINFFTQEVASSSFYVFTARMLRWSVSSIRPH